MDFADVLTWLESTRVATGIRDSLYLFPLIESFHVLGLALVFGTSIVIDLRLLGVASVRRPFMRIRADIMRWSWAAMALAAVTGVLMFVTSASIYFDNVFFRTKMVLLLLAGINVLAFELTAGRRVAGWDRDRAGPRAARTVAVLSLALWVSIIFMGRWIGYTTSEPEAQLDPGIDLEDLFTPPSLDDAEPE